VIPYCPLLCIGNHMVTSMILINETRRTILWFLALSPILHPYAVATVQHKLSSTSLAQSSVGNCKDCGHLCVTRCHGGCLHMDRSLLLSPALRWGWSELRGNMPAMSSCKFRLLRILAHIVTVADRTGHHGSLFAANLLVDAIRLSSVSWLVCPAQHMSSHHPESAFFREHPDTDNHRHCCRALGVLDRPSRICSCALSTSS